MGGRIGIYSHPDILWGILAFVETRYGSILLLDGGMGTELDRRGADITLPLWSALPLLNAPELVEEIHGDYLRAGADAIVTNSFRTHRRSLAKGGRGDQAQELTALSVEIARHARDKHNPNALIFGSVAPLEDCYRPDLVPSAQECSDEHGEIICNLLDAGVDFIILETMNSLRESIAAVTQAKDLAPGRWIINYCTKTDGPPGIMLRGSPLTDMLPLLTDAYAVGVNCVVPQSVEAQVQLLRALLPDEVQVSAYANTAHYTSEGQCGGGELKDDDTIDPQLFAEYAEQWVQAGATIVGGCCGTTPETIKAIADRLRI